MGAVVGLLLLAVACAPDPQSGDALKPIRRVDDFALVERSEKRITRDDLLGKVWVVHLFFSSCSDECKQVDSVMADLHERLKDEEDVRLVSFTCDPGTDNPAALRAHAEALGADSERWLFITGDRVPLLKLIRFSFLLPSARDTRERAHLLAGPLHSERLAVVGRRGFVRGYFDALKDGEAETLVKAVRLLTEESPGPEDSIRGDLDEGKSPDGS